MLKLRAVKTNSPVKDKHLRWFAIFKYSNWGLLAMLPLILWIAYRPYGRLVIGFDLIVGSLLYIMDILEQVNYYYYQLMYDCPADWRYLATYKRLKKSNLSRALAKKTSS
ncbi:MAG: hypothetical protein JW981_02695 [Anaerolineae bacterium]|nr:hypothetical protein [Anaerolineae bacterium]